MYGNLSITTATSEINETVESMSRFLTTNRNIELLEPYEGKLSRTVLRGERGSNALDLPDKNSKSIRYLLDFDEKGNFINVDCNIENMNIINYFKRLAWSPAETLNGKKIPLQILLKIENVSDN